VTVIVKTQAIVLRYVPVSNTSRVVSWMTRDAGKIATMIKGSLRPRSHFLGQYDLFYTCELLYYLRSRRELYIARECSPLKMRSAFRHDWRAAASASYAVDLVGRICPPLAPHPTLYLLLDGLLDTLEQFRASAPLLFWFELKLLDELGLTPRLQHCVACGKKLLPGTRNARLSYAHGGIRCGQCLAHQEDNHPASMPVTAGCLATLQGWQRSQNARMALSTRVTPGQRKSIRMLLGAFLRYHLDTPLKSRRTAFEILDSNPAVPAQPAPAS
jgi:DNA repair protein RecO (recombination protein O)